MHCPAWQRAWVGPMGHASGGHELGVWLPQYSSSSEYQRRLPGVTLHASQQASSPSTSMRATTQSRSTLHAVSIRGGPSIFAGADGGGAAVRGVSLPGGVALEDVGEFCVLDVWQEASASTAQSELARRVMREFCQSELLTATRAQNPRLRCRSSPAWRARYSFMRSFFSVASELM